MILLHFLCVDCSITSIILSLHMYIVCTLNVCYCSITSIMVSLHMYIVCSLNVLFNFTISQLTQQLPMSACNYKMWT